MAGEGLEITLDDESATYRAGEPIAGRVLLPGGGEVALRLEHLRVVRKTDLMQRGVVEGPTIRVPASGEARFAITAPAGRPSFVGEQIERSWTLDAEAGGQTATRRIAIVPAAGPVTEEVRSEEAPSIVRGIRDAVVLGVVGGGAAAIGYATGFTPATVIGVGLAIIGGLMAVFSLLSLRKARAAGVVVATISVPSYAGLPGHGERVDCHVRTVPPRPSDAAKATLQVFETVKIRAGSTAREESMPRLFDQTIDLSPTDDGLAGTFPIGPHDRLPFTDEGDHGSVRWRLVIELSIGGAEATFKLPVRLPPPR